MIRSVFAFAVLVTLAGCPAGTNTAVKQGFKTFGVGELNCVAQSASAEEPALKEALSPILSLESPKGQELLDALYRQAPDLIYCTVLNIVNTVKASTSGSGLSTQSVGANKVVLANGQAALDRWTKK